MGKSMSHKSNYIEHVIDNRTAAFSATAATKNIKNQLKINVIIVLGHKLAGNKGQLLIR